MFIGQLKPGKTHTNSYWQMPCEPFIFAVNIRTMQQKHLLSARCVVTQPKMNAVRKESDTMKV